MRISSLAIPIMVPALLSGCGSSSSPSTRDGFGDSGGDGSIDAADAAETEDSYAEEVGPNPDCPPGDYFIKFETPLGPREFRHYCFPHSYYGVSTDTPSMYRFRGRASVDTIEACAAHSDAKELLHLDRSVDAVPQWQIVFSSYPKYMKSYDRPPSVLLTREDPVGGVVEGTFEGDVSDKVIDIGEQVHLRGSFRVCHIRDHYLTN